MADIKDLLGAFQEASFDKVTLYIPTRDRDEKPVEFESWVAEAMTLLSEIGGGATRLPPAEGAWLRDDGQLIKEHIHMVYSYVDGDAFLKSGQKIREFAHRMGRELNQGEIVIEVTDRLFRIRTYD